MSHVKRLANAGTWTLGAFSSRTFHLSQVNACLVRFTTMLVSYITGTRHRPGADHAQTDTHTNVNVHVHIYMQKDTQTHKPTFTASACVTLSNTLSLTFMI